MVPEYFKFPGYLAPSSNLKFADVPNGIAAITKVPAEGWLQWVALCGCYEFCVNTPVDPADPGNYGKGSWADNRQVGLYNYLAVSDGNQWDSPFQDACLSKRLALFFWPCEHLHPGKLGRLRHMIGVWGGFVMFYGDVWCASTTPLFPAFARFPDFFHGSPKPFKKKHAARQMGLRQVRLWQHGVGHHSRAHAGS